MTFHQKNVFKSGIYGLLRRTDARRSANIIFR